MTNITELLLEIGLNRLESEVYTYLLTHTPSTAYKIGKQINKPTANVYKAIESLASKGAVLVEDNKSKVCKAVSPDEFINQFEKSIIDKAELAKELLKDLEIETDDQRSYSIDSVPLVFEKFRSMMSRCKSIAVIDAFPKALERVTNSIEEATKRGVTVFVEAYQPIVIKGAEVVCTTLGERTLEHWKSQQLNLIIDGEEHLITLMDEKLETVKQGVWSNNTYMSCILHAGLLREQAIMKIIAETEKPNFEKRVKKILSEQKFFFNTNISGFNKLLKS